MMGQVMNKMTVLESEIDVKLLGHMDIIMQEQKVE